MVEKNGNKNGLHRPFLLVFSAILGEIKSFCF